VRAGRKGDLGEDSVRGRGFAVFGLVMALLAGCTTTVTGTAAPGSPASGVEPGTSSGEPCDLLTPEQATALDYEEEGAFTPGTPEQLMPAFCTWSPLYDDVGRDSLDVYFSVDIPLVDYMDGVGPEWEEQIGGLTWARYPLSLGGDSLCALVTELSQSSFVLIMTSNILDEEAACDQAVEAAPFVSSNLPGGEPATIEPRESSPLESVEPCSLLTAEQAEKLGRRGHGEFQEADELLPARCEWVAADGDRRNSTIVGLAADRPVPRLPYDAEPRDVEAGDHTWVLYPASIPGLCKADLSVTDHSYVTITVAESEAEMDEVCAKVEDTIPYVTKNLPTS
jgi:hypothetical protein